MNQIDKKSRVSRDAWLQAGLDVLVTQGMEAVKIDHLARSLGVAKTGFYWHFKNRSALLDAMLDFWEREYTEVISGNQQIASLPPAARLEAISEMVDANRLTEYDLAIAHWARYDEEAARVLDEAYSVRMEFVSRAFRELGFRGEELEMRTRLFVCYHSNAAQMFGEKVTARDKRIRVLRNRLMIQELTKS
ncbi:MAG: TetR/AcrR family transcriptional regulator [Halieaceae bacterium]